MEISGIGLPFPAIATVKSLKFGLVTVIEELIQSSLFGSSLLGKAQGVFVVNSDDGTSYMMAMTVKVVNSDLEDCLRFFGVIQNTISESHIAVIGGTGKFNGANGYATVKDVSVEFNIEDGNVNIFLFSIYLSY
ncbi:hypothetical protein IFM89_017806 [Coptis chinensis]|uniref:Dirigent protein n=1 Tax=Coptis chinensis TaxID=261450 RepID=A0A835LMM2_9MAGN|nr:hypothetical protein IFM89_017806 [Coptis chinensis]